MDTDNTLMNEEIRQVLNSKDFYDYYEKYVIPVLKNAQGQCNDNNIDEFIRKEVGKLDFNKVADKMKLIDDNRQMYSIYFSRNIIDKNNPENVIDGKKIWKEYKELLQDNHMSYQEKTVKLHNIRSKMNMFMYQFKIELYNENHKPVIENLEWDEQMAYEGEVWMRFYDDFRYFLPDDFVMNKRVKRPPDNPINALISFGNTLLYTKTISAIYQTHLDQRISFLHEPSEGRFSLSLDISEVFKPVIVYRTIFDLVNNRKLQVEKHFDKNVNYCILNEDGRKIFVRAFEDRMESVFTHPVLKRKVSYRTALKLDCYKLIKSILEGKDFVPFSLKEGM